MRERRGTRLGVGERRSIAFGIGALAWVVALLWIFPVAWTVFTSFKTEQDAAAQTSRTMIQAKFRQSIKVAIERADTFFPADESHQDYYKKHPVQYQYYRWACGRDARLEAIWGS
mgnify:CR=1 FL=1